MTFDNARNSLWLSSIILKRDVEYYLSDKRKFIIFIAVYLSGLIVFIVALNNMIGTKESLLNFLIVGYLIVAYMNISSGGGFELIQENSSGKWDYDILMPISRTLYSLIRILGISVRGYLNFIICFLLVSPFLIEIFGVYQLLLFTLLSLVLSIILTSISITPLQIKKNNASFQVLIGMTTRTYFLFGSTIFYPFDAVPDYLKLPVMLNPVTVVLEFIRYKMHLHQAYNFPFLFSLSYFSGIFLISVVAAIYVLKNINNS